MKNSFCIQITMSNISREYIYKRLCIVNIATVQSVFQRFYKFAKKYIDEI